MLEAEGRSARAGSGKSTPGPRLPVRRVAWLSLAPIAFATACAEGAATPAHTTPPAVPSAPRPAAVGKRHPVTIHQPVALRALPTSKGDVPCATCHGLTDVPWAVPTGVDKLPLPHSGLVMQHGDLTCDSCHDASGVERLHLASGKVIELRDALTLCSQCHGPQRRDFDHGAHGGMRGHWDLAQGPRDRNHCVDCHEPHAPQIPAVQPMPPPRDRFLEARP
jgi:hypothetical protein